MLLLAGSEPAELALEYGHPKVAQLLMAHGCMKPVKAKALEHRGAILAAARCAGDVAAQEMNELLGQVSTAGL